MCPFQDSPPLTLIQNHPESIAEHWYEAIKVVIPTLSDTKQMKQTFAKLTCQIINLLNTQPLSKNEAESIGSALARLLHSSKLVPGATAQILTSQLMEGLSPEQAFTIYPKLTGILSHITTGYLKATKQEILANQRQKQIITETQLRQTTRNLNDRNRELALLNRINSSLTATLQLDQVLIALLKEVRRLLNVSACSVWLIDAETNDLVCRQSTDTDNEIVRGWRLAPGEGIAGQMVQSGRSLIVPDTRNDTRHYKGVDQKFGLELRSILSVPLRVKGIIIGAIQAVDIHVNRFSSADQSLLESLAGTAAIAVENAKLYEQAQKDAKTREILLHEVNHRVKNNLAAIIGLLYLERNHPGVENRQAYQSIINDLINRVQGLATAHNLLSSARWRPLLLSTLTKEIIFAALQSVPAQKHVSVNVQESSVFVSPAQANSLALIINELTTNTIKYALVNQNKTRINVKIQQDGDLVRFEFKNDGPGYPEGVLRLKDHNIGIDLVQSLTRDGLRGEFLLENEDGPVTILRFKADGKG